VSSVSERKINNTGIAIRIGCSEEEEWECGGCGESRHYNIRRLRRWKIENEIRGPQQSA
jgi:hypothetical protein